MTDDEAVQLDNLLDTWREWMGRGRVARGYPPVAAGMRAYRTSQDTDEMTEDMDVRIARAVDAVIDSLEPIERAALHRRYLRSAWPFAEIDYVDALQRARIRAFLMLRRRHVLVA